MPCPVNAGAVFVRFCARNEEIRHGVAVLVGNRGNVRWLDVISRAEVFHRVDREFSNPGCLGMNVGNPRVIKVQPIPKPAKYPYPRHGSGIFTGLGVGTPTGSGGFTGCLPTGLELKMTKFKLIIDILIEAYIMSEVQFKDY